MNLKRFSLLLLFLSILTASFAQRSSEDKDNQFKSNLWYGGSAGLGFQSFNGQSTFLIALYPMVGYKLLDNLSVGPRVGVAYQHIRSQVADQVYKFNPIELSGGLFARYKAFYNFFAHAEYEVANEKIPVIRNGVPRLESFIQNNFYLGAGYTSGGQVSSEIYILYNLLEEGNTLQPPWSIRGGLTYNF